MLRFCERKKHSMGNDIARKNFSFKIDESIFFNVDDKERCNRLPYNIFPYMP